MRKFPSTISEWVFVLKGNHYSDKHVADTLKIKIEKIPYYLNKLLKFKHE